MRPEQIILFPAAFVIIGLSIGDAASRDPQSAVAWDIVQAAGGLVLLIWLIWVWRRDGKRRG